MQIRNRDGLSGFQRRVLGFNLDGLAQVPSSNDFFYAYDQMQSWKGTWPESDEPLSVEAASYRGRPVYFAVVDPKEGGPSAPFRDFRPGFTPEGTSGAAWLFVVLSVTAVILAWRNLRLGRGDRRGTVRLGGYFLIVGMVMWLFHASHVSGVFEYQLFWVGLSWAATLAFFNGVFYIAMEPLVRRLWPEVLISWNRLLNGRFRDPRIGRDLLAGSVAGSFSLAIDVGWQCICLGDRWWLSLHWSALHGPASVVAVFGRILLMAPMYVMIILMLLLLARVVVRSERIAVCCVVVMMTLVVRMESGPPDPAWLGSAAAFAITACVLVRFGLLAGIATMFAHQVLNLPITSDTSADYFGIGLFGLAVVAAMAGYGYCTSVEQKPLAGHGAM